MGLRRYWMAAAGIAAGILVLFFAAQALGLELVHTPGAPLGGGGAAAALLGVGLLVADVLLPVPSSLVMAAHGALFGVWVGTLLSLAGSVGAALLGFSIGRAGGPLLARLVPPGERARADHLLTRWGALAVLVTRPVPVLAETTAILAGASPLGWARVSIAAAAGSLAPALLYALAGAMATDLASGPLVFGGVLLLSGIFWVVGRAVEARRQEA